MKSEAIKAVLQAPEEQENFPYLIIPSISNGLPITAGPGKISRLLFSMPIYNLKET
jgi:hypothetical protein